MNWIKNKLDAQAKADKEQEEKRKQDAAIEAQTVKEITKATNEAFAGLIAAIKVDVDLLNEAKQGAERFSVRTDDRTNFEFYKMGSVPETRLTLTPEPETGGIRYEQRILKKKTSQKGRIEVSTNANGQPCIALQRQAAAELDWNVSYADLSRFLLEPTF